MDSYKIVTTNGEKLMTKFELVGFTCKKVSVTEATGAYSKTGQTRL